VCLQGVDGTLCWLHQVQCVPDATANLISVSAAVRDGCTFETRDNGVYVAMAGGPDWRGKVVEENGLYVLRHALPVVPREALCLHAACGGRGQKGHSCVERDLWHQRMGHLGRAAMERLHIEGLLSGIDTGMYRCTECPTYCDACPRGKQSKLPFSKRTSAPSRILERVHVDTVGAMPITGQGGEQYFVTLVDDFSGYLAICHVHLKSQVPHVVIGTLREWERQTGKR
jgi:GAG-pre-integrase domain